MKSGWRRTGKSGREAEREAHAPIGVIAGQLLGDVRVAFRRLRSAPLFTTFAIVTLALGIGVTAAAYSLIYNILWQPVGVPDPARVVLVEQYSRYQGGFSGPEIADLRDRQTSFTGVAALTTFSSSLSIDGSAELVTGEAVSGNFFQLLGIEPIAGRLILPHDDRPDAPEVIVLSEAIWRRRFGADPHAVGRTIRMADRTFVVVGVAPASFRGVSGFGTKPQGAWVPLPAAPGPGRSFRIDLFSRERRSLRAVARLRPEQTVSDAQAAIKPLAAEFDAASPIVIEGRPERRSLHVSPAFEDPRLRTSASEMGLVILAMPALVLLIACTNLANLVLSRGASRGHEFAVRRALGAGRARLIREQLVEGAGIALAGGALGVVVTDQLMTQVVTLVRNTFPGNGHLAAFAPALSVEVLAATGGFALLAFLVSSLVPAIQLTRVSDRAVLSTDTGAGAVPRWRGRSNLIALQVAASVCLYLITALGVTLLTTELSVTERPGLGRAAVVEVPFSIQQRDEARIRSIADRVLDELRGVPGVTMTAVGSIQDRMDHVALSLPGAVSRPGVPTGESTWLSVATPELLRVTGVPMVLGREFSDRDGAGSPPVIILSRGLAGKLFGTADPVGRNVIATSRMWLPGDIRALTVVGIVADQTSDDKLRSYGGINRVSYVPFAQQFSSELAFFATGTGGDLGPIVGHLRSAIQRADPDVAVGFAGRADRAGMRWMAAAAARLVTIMSGSLATIAIVLAMAGLFGVLSHVVSRRTRELGVRIALGADRTRITRLILKDGFRPVLEGLFMGLGAAVVIRILLQPVFTKTITPFDPIAFVLGAGPILAAAAIACYLPARRAGKVDPNVALKDL